MNKITEKAIDKAYETAKKHNVQCEIIEVESSSKSIEFEDKKLQEYSLGDNIHLGVRVFKEDKEVFFSTESTNPEDMEKLCSQQMEALSFAKSNEDLQSMSIDDSVIEELEIYFERKIEAEQKIEKVKELHDAIWSCDPRIKNVTGTSLGDSLTRFRLYDKDRKSITYKKSSYGMYSGILAKDGDSLASGSYGQTKFDFEDLDGTDLITKKVKENTLGLLNSQTPKTGSYPVVFHRKAFSSILVLLVPMLQADQVHKGYSLYSDKVGEKIATGLFHIEDCPLSIKGMGTRPFDGEGSVSQKTVLVGDGNLKAFLSNKEYAKKMSIENTHNASRGANGKVGIGYSNILMRSGTLATSAIKAMKPQLIEVQNIMGLHAGFNEVSGDFSFQAEGYLYEMGERKTGLQNFVVAGNLKDLLLKIEDLGASLLDTGSKIVCPDVLVSSLKIIGS